MITVEAPQANVPLVKPDGHSTMETQITLEKMAQAIRELQAKVEALEAQQP
ncbi:hypothetical protein PhaeoP48_01211 [Phaeobacter inhibens]|uniref:hypothetical protein n=1 Tax=Phaeobacter inhibens TaxID=221822 RepID=UPI000CA26578|nr:hypothetical protein [Phaeobacter inhibens]AUR11208.1 hypothetical protein PhaeoP48_01211 [Phaeobacter inhibens]